MLPQNWLVDFVIFVFYFHILLLDFNQTLSLYFQYVFCLCFVVETKTEVINRKPCDMALHHKEVVCSPVEKQVNISISFVFELEFLLSEYPA